MGFISLLKNMFKKNNEHSNEKENSKEDAESAFDSGIFLGDLSDLGAHNHLIRQKDTKTPVSEEPGEDSDDSVVYITFQDPQNDKWVCDECGTLNSELYDGCAVCGNKNK